MRVEVYDSALKAVFSTDGGLRTILRDGAEAVMDQAVAHSPVWTGAYKSKFRVQPYRTYFRVYNWDPFANLVEWGTINNPPYAPMRTGAEASGMRVKLGHPGDAKVDEFLGGMFG